MKNELEQAEERFEQHLPRRTRRLLRWLRGPSARWVRMPLGVLCLFGGFLWFLPVLGAWMLPLGLLLLAQDMPFLRKPVARMLNWLLDRWEGWQARRARGRPAPPPG